MISLQKLKIFTPLQKLPKKIGDLGKLIVAKCFEKLLKVQLIPQSGHTGCKAKSMLWALPLAMARGKVSNPNLINFC